MNYLLINKPEGWSSFDVVAFVRNRVKKTPLPDKQKRVKVGHAGTLDPFATGLLIVGVGREATKKLDGFKNMPKTYIATIKLGATSDTDDKTGQITMHDTHSMIQPDKKQIKSLLKTFIGKQLQTPPMFSAKWVDGQRLYQLARKGITVERKANEIEIYKIKLLEYSWPILKIEVQCSAGTYIRTLAHDIGAKLETGAYCQELMRTKIGKYLLKNAINLDNFKSYDEQSR
ncbi:MAG: tRNA pseudouridine(55) synthase TruB [Candidatus Magasanikbacteria bacterium RIFOXYD2_FULL_39_9]|uniref:tRNA pseudouridine synthase B n=1 Tax=Candidatus Magasanikbacteria bacterium RIFOXYD1_FULL_40_23 TaxID=1798705 RepID=A0A1F6P9D6_9BACT|nr:MAG: tRNA pseudouridine(55) synthase TruB [Candidatus Magasanikbacteria bacterium RIFOXYD2_FULL_39_9]OGH92782.1 MAG: tRNA pseudouridine(55) synthase TruB [Candidatus Magasanikbacteria bacterium RIFOXYD1_FULL_40_23]